MHHMSALGLSTDHWTLGTEQGGREKWPLADGDGDAAAGKECQCLQ